ncbi:unnamed protein product [Darwinula stevensoni]|uniref:Protein arginine methyltransferase NDUFAF7 n=1 Tax=Darwinula stevensoni TaxID=69355 RepID=A0A7R8ZZD6_9CRUS|nr:unnamed protein product [Darwinula stevensoni]CAG0883440.1 unnamed protein product [Darwinula stevensoni]
MKEALLNPTSGYYIYHDMLGEHGDFATSPEISQLFGEVRWNMMWGIWILNEWYKLGCPKPLQLVELGPGNGTLLSDVLRKTPDGWREVLIDVDLGVGPHHLRFILSRGPTPASFMYPSAKETRNHIEVCPEASVIMGEIVNRVEEDGGFALIADYGHMGTKEDTFRALESHCTKEQMETLTRGYTLLLDPHEMGERFKFLAVFPSSTTIIHDKIPPAGFFPSEPS